MPYHRHYQSRLTVISVSMVCFVFSATISFELRSNILAPSGDSPIIRCVFLFPLKSGGCLTVWRPDMVHLVRSLLPGVDGASQLTASQGLELCSSCMRNPRCIFVRFMRFWASSSLRHLYKSACQGLREVRDKYSPVRPNSGRLEGTF